MGRSPSGVATGVSSAAHTQVGQSTGQVPSIGSAHPTPHAPSMR